MMAAVGVRSRRSVRRGRVFLATVLAAAAVAAGTPVLAQGSSAEVRAALRDDLPRDLRAFYAARNHAPLWMEAGRPGPAADALFQLIGTADLDGLDRDDYRPRQLAAALDRAEKGNARDLARADMLLSRALVSLASDMRRQRTDEMIYADRQLAPAAPTARELLDQAAHAPSLVQHVKALGWMHPLYGQIRAAAADRLAGLDGQDLDGLDLAVVRRNLKRAAVLPAAAATGRYVLVDAAAARLWMYEDGKVKGTMRVVVGKPSEPTPMMAGLIRYASINPYWNIPPDLVRLRVAPGAMKSGDAFLKAKRFQLLSGWTTDATPVSAKTVDWRAVQDGRIDARVRQLPGPGNAMGRIKFMFPNELGVYLHDTPEKELLRQSDRTFSSGCVRVEDAPRLAAWLFGKPVSLAGKTPDRRLDLREPVPVYLTYFTVAKDGDGLVYRDDVYGRDGRDDDGDRQVAAR